ncbi:MAG: hypothetical protein HC813_02125 [Planctomycetes bacterium]|nr:hypothetical protein [Planctomycetota bacterium]
MRKLSGVFMLTGLMTLGVMGCGAIDREALRAQGHAEVYRVVELGPGLLKGFVLLALVLWAPVLWFLVMKTRMGKAMRAVSEDLDAARLMGIPIDRVVAWTFFLGAFVAGVGGVAYAVTYAKVEPLTGFLPGLKAFIAAVIGGIGSIPGRSWAASSSASPRRSSPTS